MRVLPKSTPNQVNLDFGITCACSPISQYALGRLRYQIRFYLQVHLHNQAIKSEKKKYMLHMAQVAPAALLLFLFFFAAVLLSVWQ